MTRRQKWLNLAEAIEAIVSDADQQGAHVAFNGKMFRVNRGTRGSAVGEQLIFTCGRDGYVYCGFYSRTLNKQDVKNDLEFVMKGKA